MSFQVSISGHIQGTQDEAARGEQKVMDAARELGQAIADLTGQPATFSGTFQYKGMVQPEQFQPSPEAVGA
jgi:hypothetical protein